MLCGQLGKSGVERAGTHGVEQILGFRGRAAGAHRKLGRDEQSLGIAVHADVVAEVELGAFCAHKGAVAARTGYVLVVEITRVAHTRGVAVVGTYLGEVEDAGVAALVGIVVAVVERGADRPEAIAFRGEFIAYVCRRAQEGGIDGAAGAEGVVPPAVGRIVGVVYLEYRLGIPLAVVAPYIGITTLARSM